MKKNALLLVLVACLQAGFAQPKQDILYYIEKYKATAMDEMVRCGIPASITLAQGIHESNSGKSPLSREANNHFGIKCKDEWTGKKYIQDDDTRDECFRVYDHAEASYADHSDFLVTRPRYAELFSLSITDYKGWAHGLKKCGYATNPKYAQILISEIEEYSLYEYDKLGLAMKEEKEKMFAYNSTQAPMTVTKPSSAPAIAQSNTTPTTTEITQTQPIEVVEPKSNIFEATPTRQSSRKQYMVNGALVLIAQANEEPLKIAIDQDIDYSYVLMFNDMAPGEHFKEGEYIFLQSKKNRGNDEKYVVKAGESMRDVSQRTGVKLKELYQKNLMKANEQVYAGEILNLQDKRTDAPRTMSYAEYLKTVNTTTAPATAKTTNDRSNSTGTSNTTPRGTSSTTTSIPIYSTNPVTHYKVQATDTLYSIARKFNLTVQQLKNLNNLQSSNIQKGQKLLVASNIP